MARSSSTNSIDRNTPSPNIKSGEIPQVEESKASTSKPPVMLSKRAAYKESQTSLQTKSTRDLPQSTEKKTSNTISVSGNSTPTNATTTSPVRSRSSSASGRAADQMAPLTSTAPTLHSTSSTSSTTSTSSTLVTNPEWVQFHEQGLQANGRFNMDETMSFSAVCSWLASSPAGIYSASFCYEPLSPSNVLELCNAIKGNSHITELNCSSAKLGDEGAQALAKGLQGITSLTSLNLNNNDIGYLGAQALADVLLGNPGLITLNLAMNNIGDLGAQALAEPLKGNTKLLTFYLGYNVISDLGAKLLAIALETNHTLTLLNLEKNNIDIDLKKAISENLTVNYVSSEAPIRHKLRSNRNLAALTQMAETNPPVTLTGSDVPAEVVALIEQATIVADQKTGAYRTQEQMQASLNEIRLALALSSVAGEN